MSNIYLNFLPWLTLYQNITLGKVTFWNYSREATAKINDQKIKERLDKHFDSYKYHTNFTVEDITICELEGKNFYDQLTVEEYNHLQEAITSLAFASFIGSIEAKIQTIKQNHQPPSASSFKLMSIRLSINSDIYFNMLSHQNIELKEGEHYFQRPVLNIDEARPRAHWVKYLNTYLHLKSSSRLRQQILRSLEFFRLAQFQNDFGDNIGIRPDLVRNAIPYLTRSVLLATAFESLLSFPVNGKADFFAKYINDKFSLQCSRKSSRAIRKNKPKIQYSLVAWWAYDFYKLRNSIVHGDEVHWEKLRFKSGMWFSQMDVAALVFADCLEEIILTKKIIKTSRKTFDRVFEETFEKRGVYNWEKRHKVLGWVR